MPDIPPPYFYKLARVQIDEIAEYSKQWGDDNARAYLTKLFQAIDRQNAGRHDKIFPKTVKTKAIKEDIYYFHFKAKQRQKHGYSIFYRRLSRGNMGVIAILESSRNLPNHIEKTMNAPA